MQNERCWISLWISVRERESRRRSILWKIVRIFVEFDGVLEGNPKIEEEVRRILMPNLAQMATGCGLAESGFCVRDAGSS